MKRAWAILLALWLAQGIPALAASAADAQLVQAQSALAGGLYDDAVRLAGEGLAAPGVESITQSRLYVTRGLSRQAQGQHDEALLDFTMGLRGNALQGEERARALFARGLTLDGQGRLEAAAGDYTAALSNAPRAAYALNNRANVYRRQNRFAEARRDYTAALSGGTANPQYPYYGLAQIAEAEGDPQTARGLYNQALAADPNYQLARERLQALGAATEGLGADPGVILLRPPPMLGASAAAVQPVAEPSVPAVRRQPPVSAVSRQAQSVAQTRSARPSPQPAPGRGAPLRPAIVEAGASVEGLVQLGAWRSEAEAQQGWSVAQDTADGLLDGLTPVIVRAEVPGRGTYFRLRVRARGASGGFCSALESRGLACLPVRD
jgi:tetratricopeptide (TPR) repeat protein